MAAPDQVSSHESLLAVLYALAPAGDLYVQDASGRMVGIVRERVGIATVPSPMLQDVIPLPSPEPWPRQSTVGSSLVSSAVFDDLYHRLMDYTSTTRVFKEWPNSPAGLLLEIDIRSQQTALIEELAAGGVDLAAVYSWRGAPAPGWRETMRTQRDAIERKAVALLYAHPPQHVLPRAP